VCRSRAVDVPHAFVHEHPFCAHAPPSQSVRIAKAMGCEALGAREPAGVGPRAGIPFSCVGYQPKTPEVKSPVVQPISAPVGGVLRHGPISLTTCRALYPGACCGGTVIRAPSVYVRALRPIGVGEDNLHEIASSGA
jgi:hypothetical protein